MPIKRLVFSIHFHQNKKLYFSFSSKHFPFEICYKNIEKLNDSKDQAVVGTQLT
jgi:hypothetical protein